MSNGIITASDFHAAAEKIGKPFEVRPPGSFFGDDRWSVKYPWQHDRYAVEGDTFLDAIEAFAAKEINND